MDDGCSNPLKAVDNRGKQPEIQKPEPLSLEEISERIDLETFPYAITPTVAAAIALLDVEVDTSHIKVKRCEKPCEHGRTRWYHCVYCLGPAVCEHKVLRYYCEICRGKGRCVPHNKVLRDCLPCNGSAFCEHRIRKNNCAICDGRCLCESCKLFVVSKPNKDGHRLCSYCDPNSKIRGTWDENRQEMKVWRYLSDKLPDEYEVYPSGVYAPFKERGDRKKPDMAIHHAEAGLWGIIEVDEHQHSGGNKYESTCEWHKVLSYMQSLLATPGATAAHFVRFNPDSYRTTFNLVAKDQKNLESRVELLIGWILSDLNEIDESISLTYFFYSGVEEINRIQYETLLEKFDELQG